MIEVPEVEKVMKMNYIATNTYPLTSVMDVAKVFADGLDREVPSLLKQTGPYVCWGGDGIKSVTLYEIEDGHEKEGLDLITKIHVPYMKVEGFKIIIEPVYSAQEALVFLEE